MYKIYQEILEAIELKKENNAKIAEIEKKLEENLAKGEEFNNRTYASDKYSVEYQVELREKQKMDKESSKMKLEKESLEKEIDGKVDSIRTKLETMIQTARQQLEDNELIYRNNLIDDINECVKKASDNIERSSKKVQDKIEENENMKLWNSFYEEELFDDVFDEEKYQSDFEKAKEQYIDEVKKEIKGIESQIYRAEKQSVSILNNIKKMESIYNNLSVKDIEKLAEEAEKNVKRPEPKPDPKKEPKPNPKKETKPDPKKEPKPNPKKETKPDPKKEPKSDPKKEPKPDPKKEPKSDPKKEPKPDPKKEPKSDPKKEPKPDPKKEPKPDLKKEPYEKTTILIDAKRNKITICLKGETHPTYEVYNNEAIDGFIRNGKEYKKDKQYKKCFDKKALKKVDPAIFGILVQQDMEAAKEYVNSFKEGQKSLVDVKYTFSKDTINVPRKALRNYKNYAKKAEERGVATVEGILKRRSPIEMMKQWSKTNQATMLESERMKQDRLARENYEIKIQNAAEKQAHFIKNPILSKDLGMGRVGIDEEKVSDMQEENRSTKKPPIIERIGRKMLGKEYDGIKEAVEEGRAEAKAENEARRKEKDNFKDEMKKDAPTPEEQAKKAKEFEEKEKQNGKASKRERRNKRTQEEK